MDEAVKSAQQCAGAGRCASTLRQGVLAGGRGKGEAALQFIRSFIRSFGSSLSPVVSGGGGLALAQGASSERSARQRALGRVSAFHRVRTPRLDSAVSSCPYLCPSFHRPWASSPGASLVGLLAHVVSFSVHHLERQGAPGDGVLRLRGVGVMAPEFFPWE